MYVICIQFRNNVSNYGQPLTPFVLLRKPPPSRGRLLRRFAGRPEVAPYKADRRGRRSLQFVPSPHRFLIAFCGRAMLNPTVCGGCGRSKPLPYGRMRFLIVGADPLSARCIQPPRDASLLALCHSRGSKATEESTGRTLEDDVGQEAFCGCT